ncbi:MAG: fasciclin domain-containing protein [Bacteroidaceae bacterium]
MIEFKIKKLLAKSLLLGLVCISFLSSCKNDDISGDSAYTFTGETIADYLKNRPETFSLFTEVLNRARLLDDGTGSSVLSLLSSYGYYTCFAPDNIAMESYLKSKGLTSVDQLTDSVANVLARTHCVSSSTNKTIYLTKNFQTKLPDMNMNNKSIYVEPDSASYLINSIAHITDKDIEAYNGVVQHIDAVMTTSDVKLKDMVSSNPDWSIFALLLEYTNVGSRVNSLVEDFDFKPNESLTVGADGATSIYPKHRYYYYTCFIEPDRIYKEAIPELANATTPEDTLNLIKAYAKDWFEKEYKDAPKILEQGLTEDWTNEDNYLNRFVAYHFVNKKIDRADFTLYNQKMAPGYNKYTEYAETLAPNTMLCMSAGQYGVSSDENKSRLQLNPSAKSKASTTSFYSKYGWTRPASDGIFLTDKAAILSGNGYFHELEGILTFPRSDFKKMRFRFDLSSLFPELMSNSFRYQYSNGTNVSFPSGYLTNVTYNSPGTRFIYLNRNANASANSWTNYQGDEMTATGVGFDLTIRLPPVPAGTYEVRYGYTIVSNRGCGQFYLGTDPQNLVPQGIPVDLTKAATSYGWVKDDGTDADYDVDKLLHARGWMKGPNSWYGGNNDSETLRAHQMSMRRIVGVQDLQTDQSIYLRGRNATSSDGAMFMMDYIEICPAAIYDNPEVSEPRD